MKAAIIVGVVLALAGGSLQPAQTSPQAPARSSAWIIQRLAAARAGEALDLTKRIGEIYWPTVKAEKLSLMVVEPGQWALLMNHPAPPAGFTAAEPVPKHLLPDPASGAAAQDAAAEGPQDPASEPSRDSTAPGSRQAVTESWSVHVAQGSAVSSVEWGDTLIAGRRTAVVSWNEVTVPSTFFSGFPPSEAVICRMVRGLFLAHLSDLEGELHHDPASWNYRADEKDLALIAIEQRLLARLLRITVNEHTLEQYRKLFAMWLSVRRTRLTANPQAVAMEEAIERREGMADFTETVPFKVLSNLGGEERPFLEAADPFYDRYKNYFILRLNLLNYPLVWYPGTPVEALQRARPTGAGLAAAVLPLQVRWHLEFFAEPDKPKKVLRDLAEAVMKSDTTNVPIPEPGLSPERVAALLKEAKEMEGYEGIVTLMRAFLSEAASAGERRIQEAFRLDQPVLVLELGGKPLAALRASLARQRWLGPGRIQVGGPLRIAFEGGDLESDGDRFALVEGLPVPRAAQSGPASVTLALPQDWRLSVGGKPVGLSRKPGRTHAVDGDVIVEGDGLQARLRNARVRLEERRVLVAFLPGGALPENSSSR